MSSTRLDLPDEITACLFDLDGVLTRTARVHAAAWKELFDDFLRARSEQGGEPFEEFEPSDYSRYVDGKLREDGVRSFLSSRGIELPEGSEDDGADAVTVHGLASRKNGAFLKILRRDGVDVYEGSIRFVEAAAAAGVRRAVVSSSKNCREALQAAGIEDLFEARVDGAVAADEGLAGKPAPDMFVAAAARLDAEPSQCAVFEDAESGVEAGRAGNFGLVIGVNSGDNAEGLREHGAERVVDDLAELLERS